VERLEGIREEFCPSTLEDLQAAIDAGYNDLCGCAICALIRDLIVEMLAADIDKRTTKKSLAGQGETPGIHRQEQ